MDGSASHLDGHLRIEARDGGLEWLEGGGKTRNSGPSGWPARKVTPLGSTPSDTQDNATRDGLVGVEPGIALSLLEEVVQQHVLALTPYFSRSLWPTCRQLRQNKC